MAHLPEEMFSIIQHAADGLGPRLGRFQLHGRRVIQTPHYLGITSRGTIPHITQDTFRRDTNIEGVYMALEDCEHLFKPDTQLLLTGLLTAEKT